MIKIIEDALDLCKNKEDFIIASIIYKHGSAPREVGASMIVTKAGYYSGTIGGGQQEFDAINESKRLLDLKYSENKDYSVSKEDAAKSGLVCGGQSIVHFQYIDSSNDTNKRYFEKLIDFARDNQCYLVFDVAASNKNSGISIEVNDETYSFTDKGLESREIFKIKIKYPMKVFVFGGGHMAKATVSVMGFLGLDVSVVDDRDDFIKDQEFDLAKRLVKDFSEIDDIKIENSDYVLIMTRGHQNDIKVLESVLKKDPYYIGVVGNLKKKKLYFDHFQGTDLEECYKKTVHLPVGLEIAALTPEEIAISIAGQVIKSYRENK